MAESAGPRQPLRPWDDDTIFVGPVNRDIIPMGDHETTANQEFAKLINRFTDRILPDTAYRGKDAHWKVRYCITLVGTLVWSISVYVFVISNDILPAYREGIFVSVYWQLWLFVALGFFSVLISVLIAVSVKRGAPLSFFLWGFTVPTFIMGTLSFALGINGGS